MLIIGIPIAAKKLYKRLKIGIPIAVKKIHKYLKNRKIADKSSQKNACPIFTDRLEEENIEYWQTGNHNKILNVSPITKLPCLFTINDKQYNLDSVTDIQEMPLVFSSFSVNGESYYFNDYFRMCAAIYREKGYENIADALLDKAHDLESDPLFGEYIKRQSRTTINTPKKMDEECIATLQAPSEDESSKEDDDAGRARLDEMRKKAEEINKARLLELERIEAELNAKAEQISLSLEGAFLQFGISVSLVEYQTQDGSMIFYVKPGDGVRISKIKSVLDDVALYLKISPFTLSVNTEKGYIELSSQSEVYKDIKSDVLSADSLDDDPMLFRALEIAVENGKISTSLIQRGLILGYGRAAKLIDRMEQLGYVSAPDGQKPRTVLITKQELMELTGRRDGE